MKISFKQSDLECKSQAYKEWQAVQNLKLDFKDSIDKYEVAFHCIMEGINLKLIVLIKLYKVNYNILELKAKNEFLAIK